MNKGLGGGRSGSVMRHPWRKQKLQGEVRLAQGKASVPVQASMPLLLAWKSLSFLEEKMQFSP